MTSPTEQEIVARAMDELFLERSDYTVAEIAQAAIKALDSHRANNAGEVEQALRYIDADHCEHEPHVVLPWLEKAANLISSMRAAIEEKDRALKPFAETADLVPPGWEDDHSLGEWALCLDVADLRRARSRISDGAK